jgi:hypothetical protein
MARHPGRCHCGALRFVFHTDRPLSPRACQCGFCRRHGARTVSDPAGEVAFSLNGPLLGYRFGSGVTDTLICAVCGVYLGARVELDGTAWATLNLNAFEEPWRGPAARPVSYDGESAAARAERRRLNWTPVRAGADGA